MAGNNNSTYILDSSFILSYLFPDEEIDHVQLFFNRYKQEKIELVASPILPFEVLNGLKTGILKKRVDYKIALQLGKKFLKLPIKLEEINFIKTLELSSLYDLSFYDASYLYLAQTNNLQLLTLDKKLQKLS